MADNVYAKEILTDREKLIHQFGYNWTYYIKPQYAIPHAITLGILVVLGFLIYLVAPVEGWLLTTLWSILALCVASFWAVISWRFITADVRIVTNKRVVIKTGFFARKTQEIKLSAIEAITFDQTILERLLRVGTLVIEGRGGGNKVELKSVSRPGRTKHLIENIDWRETDAGFDPATSA